LNFLVVQGPSSTLPGYDVGLSRFGEQWTATAADTTTVQNWSRTPESDIQLAEAEGVRGEWFFCHKYSDTNEHIYNRFQSGIVVSWLHALLSTSKSKTGYVTNHSRCQLTLSSTASFFLTPHAPSMKTPHRCSCSVPLFEGGGHSTWVILCFYNFPPLLHFIGMRARYYMIKFQPT